MFFCDSCGNEYLKWEGKCKSCQSWGTIKKAPETQEISIGKLTINSEEEEQSEQINCSIGELNRVCSLFERSTIIIGGEPGIGKSTLMCQIAASIEGKCLYLAGEESVTSVKNRIKRVTKNGSNIYVLNFFFLDDLDNLLKTHNPKLVILDSIHTTRTHEDNNPRDMIYI